MSKALELQKLSNKLNLKGSWESYNLGQRQSTNFLLLFTSLLTDLIVKSSHFLAEIYFTFLKKRPRPNLEGFKYQILTSLKI